MYPSVYASLGFITRKSKDEKCFNDYLERTHLEIQKHQLEGVLWALKQEREGHVVNADGLRVRGGLLADEMGLGKTIQMIGTMVCNPLKHTLIVLPRALVEQWEKAISRTTGHLALVYHGSSRFEKTEEDLRTAPIVITTYHHIADRVGAKLAKKKRSSKSSSGSGQTAGATASASSSSSTELPPSLLHKITWDRIIYDEAHHLRNDGTAIGLGAKKLKANIRWLVTGTPIQNRKADFYSLCQHMGLPHAYYSNSENLMDLVRGFIMKRTKKQVGIRLPELSTETCSVEWSSREEKELAENIHSLLEFSHIKKSQVDNIIAKMDMPNLALLIRARQMCILPALADRRLHDYVVTGLIEDPDKTLGGTSGTSKIDAVVNKILSRRNNGKGKLVFCHFRGEIDILKQRLTREGLNVDTFDGRVKSKNRASILESSCDVLLLQIQTACEGLNLQQYSEIYFVSPHWNPAIEDQAIARCHRIGQDKEVNVFRFTMAGFDEFGTTKTLDAYSASVQDIKRNVMTIIDKDKQEQGTETTSE